MITTEKAWQEEKIVSLISNSYEKIGQESLQQV